MEEQKDTISTGDCVADGIGVIRTTADHHLYGIDNWPGMPLIGPADAAEANARINEAERDMVNDGGMEWDVFKAQLRNMHSHVYAV